MKTLVLAGLFVAPLFVNAQKVQDKEVPDAVKAAFSKDHSGIEAKEWEKENNNFEAEFRIGGKEHSVVYDVKGQLIETESEIAAAELPEAASQYIEEHFDKPKVKEATKVTSANGTVTYEAYLGRQDLVFDSLGNFLGIEKEDAEDED